jgi:hypothetical protein
MDELTPDERARVSRVADVLARPEVWVEPDRGLEARILDAIDAEAARRPRRRRRPHRGLALAAAAAVVFAVALSVVFRPGAREVYEIALDGTALAPAASGDASLVKTASGWKITLSAAELVRRDQGTYYEAWLKNASGTAVPIGTFNDGRDVTLWSGVSPERFPTLTITAEVADGQQDSSGRVVLIGRAHKR